jgi:hypothetical protein
MTLKIQHKRFTWSKIFNRSSGATAVRDLCKM